MPIILPDEPTFYRVTTPDRKAYWLTEFKGKIGEVVNIIVGRTNADKCRTIRLRFADGQERQFYPEELVCVTEEVFEIIQEQEEAI